MKQSKQTIAKIGIVNYLNTAPIYEKWKETVHRSDWHLIEVPPATLNKELREGKLDLCFISSFEYAIHPESYKILSGLSVSANGPVGSVFLFSHLPMEQLDNQPVLLSDGSETSVGLMKIILEEFNNVRPKYSTGDVVTVADVEYQALMATGDDALKLVEKSRFLYQYDLGDIWKRETGLPFVFALLAVRDDFSEEHPEMLAEIHQELLRCSKEGKDSLQEICSIAAPRIPMSKDRCQQYLQAIEYDLGAKKRQAIKKYFNYLVQRGDIKGDPLPLRFFSKVMDS